MRFFYSVVFRVDFAGEGVIYYQIMNICFKTLICIVFLTCKSYSAIILDVVFVVDDSGSIDSSDYLELQSTLNDLSTKLDHELGGTHVGLVSFSSNSILQTSLISDESTYQNVVNNMFQSGGQTNTSAGLLDGYNDLTNNGRAGVAKIVVLITDGVPNEPSGGNPIVDAISQANQIKDDGFFLYAIGVGGGVDSSDLEDLASNPTADYIGVYNDYSSLAADTTAVASFISSHGSVANVPEPSSVLLSSLSGCFLLLLRRRRMQ